MKNSLRKHSHLRCLVIPFVCFLSLAATVLLTDSLRIVVIIHAAWVLCAALLLTAAFLAFLVWNTGRIRSFLSEQRYNLLFVSIIPLLYFLHDEPAHKVVLDELVLQGTALHMFEHLESRNPVFGHDLEGHYEVIGGFPDKRPAMYPFTVSLLHRVLGYNLLNAFILNYILGTLFLISLLYIASSVFPKSAAGFFPVLFASLPLLSQIINSAHFEMLYLLGVSVLFTASLRFVRNKSHEWLALLYVVALILAMTRYEGVLFLFVPFGLSLIVSGKPHASLKLVYILAPAVTIYLACLISYINSHPEFWQLETLASESAFGVEHLGVNSAALFAFLFSTDGMLPNSILLSFAGLISFAVVIAVTGKALYPYVFKQEEVASEKAGLILVTAVFIPVLAAYLFLIFFYHWGAVNTYATARFTLFPLFFCWVCVLVAFKEERGFTLWGIFLLASAVGVSDLFHDTTNLPEVWTVIFLSFAALVQHHRLRRKAGEPTLWIPALLFLAFFFLFSLPKISQRKYEGDYSPAHQAKVFFEWVDRFSGQQALFIADSSLYGILKLESASSIRRFNSHRENLRGYLETGKFSNIFILQGGLVSSGGEFEVLKPWKIESTLEFNEIERVRLHGDAFARIGTVTLPPPASPPMEREDLLEMYYESAP